jgi:hypothetical protein
MKRSVSFKPSVRPRSGVCPVATSGVKRHAIAMMRDK